MFLLNPPLLFHLFRDVVLTQHTNENKHDFHREESGSHPKQPQLNQVSLLLCASVCLFELLQGRLTAQCLGDVRGCFEHLDLTQRVQNTDM